jgi:hypothetical protein
MASGLFLSYRRDDSAGHVGRLYDALRARLGGDRVFMDIDRIRPGEDFVQSLDKAIAGSSTLLVIIGNRWLSERLRDPKDFVRQEISVALAKGLQVIPVLVQGARMPAAEDLPEDLQAMARRQAFELSDQRWPDDVARLCQSLPMPVMPVTGTPKWVWAGVAAVVVVFAVQKALWNPTPAPIIQGPIAGTPSTEIPKDSGLQYPPSVTGKANEILQKLRREWRKDAILVAVKCENGMPNPAMGYSVQLSFVSPAEGEGMTASWDRQEVVTYFPHNSVNWGLDSIMAPGEKLTELKAAMEAARAAGMKGKSQRVELGVDRIGTKTALTKAPVWKVYPPSGGAPFCIEARTGQTVTAWDESYFGPRYLGLKPVCQ